MNLEVISSFQEAGQVSELTRRSAVCESSELGQALLRVFLEPRQKLYRADFAADIQILYRNLAKVLTDTLLMRIALWYSVHFP